MISPLLEALSWLAVALLAVFTIRRLVMVVAALLPACGLGGHFQPAVAVIVPVRNEEIHLPGLLEALSGLEYPQEKLYFILVNDASSDSTGAILRAWASSRPNTRYLELERHEGKARALNLALGAAAPAELVGIYDADLRPRPDSLGLLAAAFQDPRVGAAAGYRRPADTGRNCITAYGALESYVHQLVTQAGKDRLGLNPTTMGGNCVYRRAALSEVGGFPPGSLSEDIEVSLALSAKGWRSRFCLGAVAESDLVQSLPRYWNQRARWTRGIYRSARKASRLESWLVSAGYIDRLVFLASLLLAAAGYLEPFWLALYVLAPVTAVAAALRRARVSVRLAAFILACSLPMFVVDVAATVAATVNSLLRRRLDWPTGRATV